MAVHKFSSRRCRTWQQRTIIALLSSVMKDRKSQFRKSSEMEVPVDQKRRLFQQSDSEMGSMSEICSTMSAQSRFPTSSLQLQVLFPANTQAEIESTGKRLHISFSLDMQSYTTSSSRMQRCAKPSATCRFSYIADRGFNLLLAALH